jgi:uncharacterized damage-inducible protein DinB
MENDFTQALITLFERDLNHLEKEINLYPDEESLWKVSGDIKNSAGTLCLHLCGNLQHFIGAILGNSGYVRDRDYEFAARNIPRKTLLNEILQSKKIVTNTLGQLDAAGLKHDYPVQVFGHPMTTLFFLMHLAGHLNYHLGQVNYHRRILGGE